MFSEMADMHKVSVGDIVEGFGWRRNKQTIMKVTKLNYTQIDEGILDSITGRVISRHGRLTTVEETIGAIDLINTPKGSNTPGIYVPRIVKKVGGWRILEDFEIKTEAVPLSARIRELEEGASLKIERKDHTVNTCRCTASLIGDETGNKYRVNKTQYGCKITRVE